MTKKSDAPAIRFKGFSDAWEQRKAKEICSIGTGKSNTQDQVNDGKYPFYIRSDVPVRSNKYLYDCEAVITIGDGNIGKVFHYVNGKFDLHQRCYKMTDFKDIWGKYFFYYFSTKFYDRAMKMTAKATVDSVRLEMISEMDIKKPPQISEQKQIAEFFANLDNLITLHQRQHFLHSTPDISLSVRLIHPFYTSSWEQRKFDEVFDCTVPNNTLSRAELSYDEGTVLNVHYGDVLIKYGSVLDVQKDDIPRIPHRCREDFNGALLQDGDVIIADTAEDETTGKACEIGNLQGSAIVSGLHTMVCRPRNRMALGYLGYYLNSNAYHHQLLPLMQGIKVLSLSRSNIQKTSVSYPIAVKEQQLIAYYFSQLDNLITLHQRKGKAAVSGCSNDANNSKGVCCKARDFGYKCHKKDEPNRFDA